MYLTGNPIGPDGSTDPRDLSDNAQIADVIVNDTSRLTVDSRLGEPLKTMAGFSNDFNEFLANSGFEIPPLEYAGALQVDRPTQLIERAESPGLLYSVKLPTTFPVILSGNWTIDEPLLVVRADQGLRSELASDIGGTLIRNEVAGGTPRMLSEKWQDERHPRDFGATGDGVTDDTAAFTAFEATAPRRPVDLHGLTYAVSAIPRKAAYYNGTWLVSGNRRVALLGRSFLSDTARAHCFGGQLRKLRRALGDPFQQYTGIVFIGDSITWGTGATGTNNPDPRDGTLSDPRDYFATASFVNEFKRYIGQRYAPLASPILSNHPASPSGESNAEYQREVIMYPRYGEISVTQAAGASMSITDVFNSSIPGGGQLRLSNGNNAIPSSHEVSFSFTGTAFRVVFSCVQADSTFYELLVDGVSQGTFSMKAGAAATSGTVTDGQVGAYYDHTFAFVRNKTITIRTQRNGETGSRIARFNAIRILKRIVIKNQGINGSAARTYGPNNLSGSFGDGVAVEATDSFVFCQLGTNDRGIPGANQNPRGPNIFRRYLDATLDYLSADIGLILMCSPQTSNENPAQYWLNMTDIRDTIIREADQRQVDFIDNFSIFDSVDMTVATSDGLHPNNFGYALMAQNIINALESA